MTPVAAMAGRASCHHIHLIPMEQRTSSTVLFVFLISTIYGEIKGSTQGVTQHPCERNKKAISLCETSSGSRPAGFLTYNMSASPEWCNCSLSTDQEDMLDVQYSTTIPNSTYDFVLHVARVDGGNISGRHGLWNDSISKQTPWIVYLSKANLKTERAAIQGLCFSYDVKNETTRFSILCRTSDMEPDKAEPRNTSLVIWFLCGLAGALAFAAVVVVFIFQKPRCLRRDERFSSSAQDEILTALQSESRGEKDGEKDAEKDGEKDAGKDGLKKTTDECRRRLPMSVAQGACISSSEVIQEEGVTKGNSAGGYLRTTREAGTPGNFTETGNAQTHPSADEGTSVDKVEKIQMADSTVSETGNAQTDTSAETGTSAKGGVRTSNDNTEEFEMVDNIVYETGSALTGISVEDGVRKSDNDAEKIEMVDNIVYETCSGGGK